MELTKFGGYRRTKGKVIGIDYIKHTITLELTENDEEEFEQKEIVTVTKEPQI